MPWTLKKQSERSETLLEDVRTADQNSAASVGVAIGFGPPEHLVAAERSQSRRSSRVENFSRISNAKVWQTQGYDGLSPQIGFVWS